MKKLFVISFCLLLVIGCGKPKHDIIQPEVYTKAEVDSLLIVLRNNTKQSVDLLVDKQIQNDSLIVENSLEFNNYRKNITAIQIPDEVTFCGQVIPLDRPDVRQRFEKILYFYTDNQPQLMLYKQRSNLFFHVMDSMLIEAGLSTDIKYIAVIESALRPSALSRAGAKGFWQFMYWTADAHEITNNHSVDMRNNLIASTAGAILYLKSLYEKFHDWFLAFAGYNRGENGLARDIKEQGTRDYFEIIFPQRETEEYVLRAAAVKLILEDPDRFGIPQEEIIPWVAPKKEIVTVRVRNRLRVRWVADWCETTYRQIKLFNPELKGDKWGPGKYEISIPAGQSDHFYQGLKDIKSGKYKIP
ncbi:MAG: lytic transglycosylase domain-containing protein [Candidatus Kerfeldbacteria bacterium]